jgi:hypothetical protein
MLDYVIAFGMVSGFMALLYGMFHLELAIKNWWLDWNEFYHDMMED